MLFPRRVFDDGQCLRRIRGRDHRHAGLDDAGFFRRDFCQCVAQPLLVVKRDVGDDAGEWRDDVCRIQPSAEAGFPNYQSRIFAPRKISAPCTVMTSKKVGWWSAENCWSSGWISATRRTTFIFRDQLSVDLNPLAKRNQMRRSEQTDPQAGRAVNALQHGARRTFAVRASDVNETEFLLRIAGQRGKLERVFQPEFCAEQAERIKKFNGGGVSRPFFILHSALILPAKAA